VSNLTARGQAPTSETDSPTTPTPAAGVLPPRAVFHCPRPPGEVKFGSSLHHCASTRRRRQWLGPGIQPSMFGGLTNPIRTLIHLFGLLCIAIGLLLGLFARICGLSGGFPFHSGVAFS